MMEVAVLFLVIGTVIFLFAVTVVNIPRLLRLLVNLLFPQLRVRKEANKKAREVGIQTCKKLYPDEPVLGAGVCDEEANRYVVRVFYGNRHFSIEPYRAPPWRDCLVVSVQKDTYVDEVIDDDQERYRPVIR